MPRPPDNGRSRHLELRKSPCRLIHGMGIFFDTDFPEPPICAKIESNQTGLRLMDSEQHP
jgi:hypothetical protein